MAEESFPVIEKPLSAEQWQSVTLGIGSGVLHEGGFPYNLTNISNQDNTVQVTVSSTQGYAHAIVHGFYHKIDAPVTLSVPAVSSATTYYIALQYDPLREELPVKLDAYTSLDRSQGKQYVILHEIDRQPNQLLTDAVRRFVRPRVAPTIIVSRPRELPDPSTVLWGTTAVIHGGSPGIADLRMAIGTTDDGPRTWQSILSPPWEALPDTTNAVRYTSGVAKQIQRIGRQRKITGRVRRASQEPYWSSSDAGYLIASLAAKDLPAGAQRFTVRGSGGVTGYVEANRQNSELRLWIPSGSTYWVDLGVIEYTADEWV